MIGKKSDISKKDMNFFSEFSSAGAQTASILTLALIIFAILLVIAVVFLSIVFIRTNSIQSDIDEIREELNDPDNLDKLSDYDDLVLSLDDRREYLFVLTDLKAQLEQRRFAETENMDIIEECVPDDVALTDLFYADGSIQIGGTCVSHDSALNFIAQLQENDLFTYVHIGDIYYQDPPSALPPEIAAHIWNYYFSFIGTLEEYYQVTVTRYYDGVPPVVLSVPVVREYAAGSNYFFDDRVSEFSADGRDYVLSGVTINGDNVTPEEFERILQDDMLTGITLRSMDIRLMYVEPGASEPEGGEVE